MKTSKPVLQTSAQEECGVWLDTVQLKAKAKQKRVARPISKLLNPFAGGGGYSLAVALNFTQTKIEMPKTKQTSISTFFAPQRRILNKMSLSEAPAWSASSSISTDCTPIASGTKRRRGMDREMSDFYNSEDQKENAAVNHEWKCKYVTKPEAAVWQEQNEASYSPPQNMYCEFEEQSEEIKPPERKRRLIETSSLPGDSQSLLQAWSQDPLITYDSQFDLANQKYTTAKDFNDSKPSFLNSLQSEEAFITRMDLEGKTSTQKSFKHFHSSQIDDEKVCSRSLSSNSPSKHSPLSHLGPNRKRTEPKTASPRKNIPEHTRKKADKEESLDSQFKWTKPSSSPFKKRAAQQQGREVDEDSLAMLFTQDSEGFRVIAHRGLQARSPLKDQTNMSTWTAKRNCAYKSVFEEDEEDEILFTQDSQGNMVMKH